MAAAGTLAAILAAVRQGRVTPASARTWAARAARGESIAAMAMLTPAPLHERLGPQDTNALANDLAAILATGSSYAAPGEPMGDEEAALLWPPRTGAEADSRRALVSAAAAHAAALPEADLYAALFGDGPQQPAAPYPAVPFPQGNPVPSQQGQTGRQADAPGRPGGHQVFTGTHSHAHSDYQPGDGGPQQHVHPHTHEGDANHDHHGG